MYNSSAIKAAVVADVESKYGVHTAMHVADSSSQLRPARLHHSSLARQEASRRRAMAHKAFVQQLDLEGGTTEDIGSGTPVRLPSV